MDQIKEEEIASRIDFKVWGKIFRYIFRHAWVFILLLAGMFLSSFIYDSLKPLINRAAITALEQDTIASWTDSSIPLTIGPISLTLDMTGYLLISFVTVSLNALLTGGIMFLTHYLNVLVMIDLRRESFRKIQELSFSYFDQTPSGWIIARVQNDTSRVSNTFAWGILQLFWCFFDVAITLVTMFSVDWRLSLIVLAFVPLICVIGPIFEFWILKLSRKLRAVSSSYVSWISECINGNKTIKALNMADRTYEEAAEIASEIKRRTRRCTDVQAWFRPILNIISTLTTVTIIVISSLLMDRPDVGFEIASFVLFFGFIGQIYNPLLDTADILSDILGTQASVEKIMNLIETEPAIADRPDVIDRYGDLFHNKTEEFSPIKGDIKFDDVSFSYVEGVEVIHGLTKTIAAGSSVAIVGETGSGKSTTVNLLCRFYEPTKGRILIDGVDYRDRSVGFLRSKIGFVQQTPFLFNGTIRDNIRYGKLDASDAEIEEAAKAVEIDSFIRGLKDGYDTRLEDGGNELSTGQKQLISFARAIVRDPSIMILDEATASIDTETEAVIQKAINRILKGRTSIIIAHRLSTIVDCDRILVMKDGVVVEDGTHRDLMAQKGYYHELYMNQFKEFSLDEQISKEDTL